MNVIWHLTVRQLTRNKIKTFYTICGSFFSVVLLTAVLIGGKSLYESFNVSSYSIVAPIIQSASYIMAFIIMIGTSFLIQGSFVSSLAQQTKMFGQLRSIGATHKQICLTSISEAAIIACISIPMGVLTAISCLQLTFFFLNQSIALKSRIGSLHLSVDISILILCVVVALLNLGLAVTKPFFKARSISPLDALSLPTDFSQPKKLPTWNFNKKASVQLAHRNLTRCSFRFRTLSIGLAACCILLLSSFTFSQGISFIYKQQTAPFSYRLYIWMDSNKVSEKMLTEIAHSAVDTKAVSVELLYEQMRVVVLNDNDFLQWYGELLPQSSLVVPFIAWESNDGLDAHAADMFVNEILSVTFGKKGSTQKNLPLSIGTEYGDSIIGSPTIAITNRSAFDFAVKNFPEEFNRTFAIYFDTMDGALITKIAKPLMESYNLRYEIQDYTPTSVWEANRITVSLLINLCLFGFSTLVFVICTLSILNTVSSGMIFRKREFALLRSIGLTSKELNNMLIVECLSYSLLGLLLGIPSGLLVSYFISLSLQVPFFLALPCWFIILSAFCMFGTGVLSLQVCQSILKRFTIVEGLVQ